MTASYIRLDGPAFRTLVGGGELVVHDHDDDIHIILADIGFAQMLALIDDAIIHAHRKADLDAPPEDPPRDVSPMADGGIEDEPCIIPVPVATLSLADVKAGTDCDEFDCPDCGNHIYSAPKREPPPTVCCTCQWLNEYVSDPEEREAIRQRTLGA